MNAAHWHLVLNHLPVVGGLAAVLLLGWAWLKNTEDLKRVALTVSVLVALTAIPAFLTGEPAESMLKGVPGVARRWISAHEDMAEIALWGAVAVGVLALAALVRFRRAQRMPRWLIGLMFILALVVLGLMGRTASFGGRIHHPEISIHTTISTSAEGSK
jgi:hypothetical protein